MKSMTKTGKLATMTAGVLIAGAMTASALSSVDLPFIPDGGAKIRFMGGGTGDFTFVASGSGNHFWFAGSPPAFGANGYGTFFSTPTTFKIDTTSLVTAGSVETMNIFDTPAAHISFKDAAGVTFEGDFTWKRISVTTGTSAGVGTDGQLMFSIGSISYTGGSDPNLLALMDPAWDDHVALTFTPGPGVSLSSLMAGSQIDYGFSGHLGGEATPDAGASIGLLGLGLLGLGALASRKS